MKFNITILGSGSALPTLHKNPTSQFINVQERFLLIDCGEGTQLQLRKHKLKFQKIDHIFISHLHGDHYLGLIGLLSSFHLLGRKKTINIYAPKGLEQILNTHFKVSHSKPSFNINFIATKMDGLNLLHEDKIMNIYSFPLNHRIDCNGFLIKEKLRPRSINKKAIKDYNISIKDIAAIKNGDDFKFNGETIPNSKITTDPPTPRSYAFCSDTKYDESIIEFIKGVDLLYHEATFLENMKERAKETYHSTATDAATIAFKADVKKLLLGHYSARYKDVAVFEIEAKKVFKNVIAVNDGDSFEITSINKCNK